MIKKRNILHKTAKQSNSPELWSKFRNDVNKLIRKAKAEYNNKLIEQLNSSVISGKQWFKIANKFRKQQSIHTIPTLIDGESEASTNEDNATLLNFNFCSQSSIDFSNHHLPNIPTTDRSISEKIYICPSCQRRH